jgi:hypothetical protein
MGRVRADRVCRCDKRREKSENEDAGTTASLGGFLASSGSVGMVIGEDGSIWVH